MATTEDFAVIVKRGNEEELRSWIAEGGDVNQQNKDGMTPLHFASCYLTIQVLLQAGAQLETVNFQGFTPLMSALYFGNFGVAQELLKAGANPKAVDKIGRNCLALAAHSGSSKVVDLMVMAEVDLEATDQYSHTPLMIAAAFGSAAATKSLIAAGANLDTVGNYGATALSLACYHKKQRSAEVLVAAGAKVETSAVFSPLAEACRHGLRELAVLLLVHEALPSPQAIEHASKHPDLAGLIEGSIPESEVAAARARVAELQEELHALRQAPPPLHAYPLPPYGLPSYPPPVGPSPIHQFSPSGYPPAPQPAMPPSPSPPAPLR
jgi:hypothetical protein